MDPARTRLYGAAEEILDFLQLLEVIEELAVTRASDPDIFPPPVRPRIDRMVALAAPATLHRLGYQVAMVFGYAAFERYIRDLIVLVSRVMSMVCTRYSDLPEGVRDNHLRLTLKVAALATERSTYNEPAVASMLSRLLGCLDGSQPYALNDEVFADHPANFRTTVLRDALRRVGVEVAEERTTPSLSALLDGELNGLYARPSSVIDDLAQRRNEAAHGDESELLGRPTLRAVIKFVRGYADALAHDAFEHLAHVVVTRAGKEIGQVEHTWRNRQTGARTVCSVLPAMTLLTSQRILIAGSGIRLATIQSIELEHVGLDAAGPSELSHGVDLGVAVHDGERLYAIPDEELSLIEGLAEPGAA